MPAPRPIASLLLLTLAVSGLVTAPASAEGLRTVVVPSGGGVVVAPRSAPPRLAARPAQARTVTVVPAAPAAPTSSALGGYALPALSLIPLAAAAALFAAGSNGGGGSGTVAPVRTQ